MSSFLSPEDFNAIMSDSSPKSAETGSTVTTECAEPTQTAVTIPVAELLEYGVEAKAVPDQHHTGVIHTDVKPVQSVSAAHDPRAKPTCGLNLRLNEYQIELIRKMADKEERSMQQIVKRMLIPALEDALTEAA